MEIAELPSSDPAEVHPLPQLERKCFTDPTVLPFTRRRCHPRGREVLLPRQFVNTHRDMQRTASHGSRSATCRVQPHHKCYAQIVSKQQNSRPFFLDIVPAFVNGPMTLSTASPPPLDSHARNANKHGPDHAAATRSWTTPGPPFQNDTQYAHKMRPPSGLTRPATPAAKRKKPGSSRLCVYDVRPTTPRLAVSCVPSRPPRAAPASTCRPTPPPATEPASPHCHSSHTPC
jgi:hypothetical protein